MIFIYLLPVLPDRKYLLYKRRGKNLGSRPCENSLVEFSTSEKRVKKLDFRVYRSAEVQKSAREFSHGLNLIYDSKIFLKESTFFAEPIDFLIVLFRRVNG